MTIKSFDSSKDKRKTSTLNLKIFSTQGKFLSSVLVTIGEVEKISIFLLSSQNTLG